MYSIDLQGATPLYEQVYNRIVELVVTKVLKPGDQIPSVRALAKELSVNPNTVSKAYNQLENDKVIYSLAGRGSFISDFDGGKVKEDVLLKFDECVDKAKNVGIDKSEVIDRINDRWECNK